ncbi:hypothetical protein ACFQL4_16765 [Halosimplex aquaticum]
MRETHRNLAFVALGLVLLAAAAVVPVGTVHWHDTSVEQPDYIEGNETGSERRVPGRRLREPLRARTGSVRRHAGERRGVPRPPSDGADDYDYPTRAEVIERANMSDPGARYPMHVIVERPNGTVDLPPLTRNGPTRRTTR